MAVTVASITAPNPMLDLSVNSIIVNGAGGNINFVWVSWYTLAQTQVAGFTPQWVDPNAFALTYIDNSATPSVSVQFPAPITMHNGTQYRGYVLVAGSDGILSTVGAAGSIAAFTVQIPLPDMLVSSPGNLATITTSRPTLNGIMTSNATSDSINPATGLYNGLRSINSQVSMKRTWQFATDTAFTHVHREQLHDH
jgi:hypothetical protein